MHREVAEKRKSSTARDVPIYDRADMGSAMLDPYADNVKRGAHERAASEGAYMKPRAAGGKAGGVKPPPQADI